MSKIIKPSQRNRQMLFRQPVHLPLRDCDWNQTQLSELRSFIESDEILTESLNSQGLHLPAALRVLRDLRAQGWLLSLELGSILASPPTEAEQSPESKLQQAKAIRDQELLARASQFEKPSVRAFIQRTNIGTRSQKSISEIVLGGPELIERINTAPSDSPITPRIQLVRNDDKCNVTGIKNNEVWRYFRHTWTSKYATTPGRSQAIIYRDEQSRNSSVFGIGALSSAVVQLTCRDKFIGWQVDREDIERLIEDEIFDGLSEWIEAFIAQQISDIYIDDIANEDAFVHLWTPRIIDKPSDSLVSMCRSEADRINLGRDRDRFKVDPSHQIDWELRARSELFKVKRLRALAELFEIKIQLAALIGSPNRDELSKVLSTESGWISIQKLLRKAKASRVGTVLADLTVCGSIEPYSALAAGKLVAMLSVGPEAVDAYNKRYANQVSEIASAIAGREIRKENRLAFIGTTSLYGTFNQYTRLSMPTELLGGRANEVLKFHSLGKTEAVGSSHFLDDTVDALSTLATSGGTDSSRNARLSGEFGEGSSPRLRKVAAGLSGLGWPTNRLLWHGRQREVFGVPLIRNLTRFSLGLDEQPEYLYDINLQNSSKVISDWWWERWGQNRFDKEAVVNRIRSETPQIGLHGSLIQLEEVD